MTSSQVPDATNWFHAARFGTFQHFLADEQQTPEQWNAVVDAFNVDRLADQLAEAGVGYHFITVGQNSGFYCTPNAYYAEATGQGNRLSRRDLIADLSIALQRHGIRLMAYSTCLAPCRDRSAMERLACTPTDPVFARRMGLDPSLYAVQPTADARLSVFQLHWEAVHREWSERWRDMVHGWWIDGCYGADEMYRHEDSPNFTSFLTALKAGNHRSIVAFNPGCYPHVRKHCAYEDYTAGEWDDGMPVLGGKDWLNRPQRSIDGAQAHVLGFLGRWWGCPELRFQDAFVSSWTGSMTESDWVVTWDIAVSTDGRISESTRRQLGAIRDRVRR